MLWRPVLLMDPEGGANCSVPKTGLTVSVLIDPPYTEFESGKVKGILGLYLHKIIKNCFIKSPECRLSASVFRMKVFNDTASFFSDIEENKTDLAFPISSPRKKNMSDESYTGPNMHFEVFIKSVEYSLIMDVKNFNRKMNDIVFAALLVSVWPIVVFTLLIAGISGIFVWILETYFNEEEFPRSFTKGSYEGFWWAFVSMTTVGYGDKTPKFIFGRVFGVLWILTGLVVIAMFTATATSALSVNPDDLARLEESRIGDVKKFDLVRDMFDELEHGELDGILMDKYKAGYYLDEINNEYNEDRFKVFNSYPAHIPYYLAIRMSDQLKEFASDESCFMEEIEKQDIEDLLMQHLKPATVYNADSDGVSVFSGKSPATHQVLFIILGIFLGLVFLGIIAEVVYWKVLKSNKKVENGDDGIELKEVRVQSVSRVHLKDVEDKLGQLVREVGKLQEQFTEISSHANGTFGTGQNTSKM
ncbi:hypothetical protein ACROYT_G010144 [Oculina patagonica]